MGLDMIKPFKILGTRDVPGIGTGVDYLVSKTEAKSSNTISTMRYQGHILVPLGEDIDNYLFNQLRSEGWFQ